MTTPGLRERKKARTRQRSEEHTSELQSQSNLVCRLLLEKKKKTNKNPISPKRNPIPPKNTPLAPTRIPIDPTKSPSAPTRLPLTPTRLPFAATGIHESP